jgi:hypothetical protein
MSRLNPTNQEFVQKLMARSRHGALMEMVVISALAEYATFLTEFPQECRDQMAKSFNQLGVDPERWMSAAREMREQVEAHLARPIVPEEPEEV